MLCESVTRNVVKKPNKVCCDSAGPPDIVNPITVVIMKQTIETNDAVSSAKTMSYGFYHVSLGKNGGTRRMYAS